MKIKHNKKRNTAFVYEALINEATVALLKKDVQKRNKAVGLIKKHFKTDSVLRTDLECYRSLYENQDLETENSKRIIKEAKLQKRLIDPDNLFGKQTELIHDINKELSSTVFNNFVPNYKNLATIDQIFSIKTSPKNQIILENEIIDKMSNSIIEAEKGDEIDNIVYRTFVEKFNNKYDTALLSEQQELLSYYISSFMDNALELKIFLNEEIKRLKQELVTAINHQEFQDDNEMQSKAKNIIQKLNEFSTQPLSDELLLTVMKTQELIREIGTNGNQD